MRSIIGSTFARTPISIWYLQSDVTALRRDGMHVVAIAAANAAPLPQRALLASLFSNASSAIAGRRHLRLIRATKTNPQNLVCASFCRTLDWPTLRTIDGGPAATAVFQTDSGILVSGVTPRVSANAASPEVAALKPMLL
jgi:hypothetical protein